MGSVEGASKPQLRPDKDDSSSFLSLGNESLYKTQMILAGIATDVSVTRWSVVLTLVQLL